MNNELVAVDELILEIADYKNDYADMAAEKLCRKCSTSWQAYHIYEAACTIAGYPTEHDSSRGAFQDDTSESGIWVGV